MFRLKTLLAPGLALALALTFGAGTASADIAIYDLETPNSQISGFSGPFIQVTVNRTDSMDATITFSSLVANGNINLMGGGGGGSAAVAVDVTGSVTPGTPTGGNSGTGFTPGPLTLQASPNMDGFGTYGFGFSDFDGFIHSFDNISFTVTNTAAGGWTSALNVLTDAAAHAFITPSPADASSQSVNTGYVSGLTLESYDPGPVAPEPSTMLIAAVGAIGFVGYGLRRRRKS
jgi:hypothetical protein